MSLLVACFMRIKSLSLFLSTYYFFIQRYNAVAVFGTFTHKTPEDEI